MPTDGPDGAAAGAGGALTHIDSSGHAHMVDVTGKPWTLRRALARCRVELGKVAGEEPTPSSPVPGSVTTWSELFGIARLAGIQGAKQTADLIPLCHPLPISEVEVRLALVGGHVDIEGTAVVVGQTGVEMEALTACAVAALTIVEAVLPVDPDVSVHDLGVWEKSGGRSGTWSRSDQPVG